MENLHIIRSFVNTDRKALVHEDREPVETRFDGVGDLFRHCQKEYGRCTNKVYIDVAEEAKQVGWIFQKRQQYTDCRDTYLQETWIHVCDGPDTVVRTRHHHFIE